MKLLPKSFRQNPNLFRMVFFNFLIDQVHVTRQVCKEWAKTVSEILQQDLNMIKSKLQAKYLTMFTIEQNGDFIFKQQASIYRTPDARKINMDLFIKVHLKQKYDFGPSTKYTISYSYELSSVEKKKMVRSKRKAKKYFWKLEFEYVGEENTKKTIWMYKDYKSEKCYSSDNEGMIEKEGNEDSIPYIMDCVPVRKGEVLQIRLPYCVRNNLVNLSKLEFYAIEQQAPQKLSTIQKFFQTKLSSASKEPSNRCYIESMYEWKKYDYFKNPISFELDDAINCYKEELQMQEIYVNNLQDHFRVEFQCKKQLKESRFMGHFIEIKANKNKAQKFDQDNQSLVELKRKGIYEEHQKKLIFRVGDQLLLYLCDLKGE